MKKFLCVVLSLIIVLSSIVAYADTDTLFNAGKDIKSANTHTEFTVRLNKPFDFITELTEELGDAAPIDIKQLAESGVSITENADVSYSVSDDGKKVKLAAVSEIDVPLVINSDFKADIWARTGMWLEMDITDEENPVLCIIYKTPFSNKYYVIEYSDIVELEDFSHEEFMEGMKTVNNDELFGGDEKFFKDLIMENVEIEEKTSNKLYGVTADDTGFKNIVKGIAEKLFDAILEVLAVYEEIDNEEWRYQFEEYMSIIDDHQLIGKDGISATVTLEGGKLKVYDYSMHINFNLHDLITAYGGDLEEYNRDLWEIDCTISIKTDYENVNENIEIDFPEITEENSWNIMEPDSKYNYEYQYNTISIYQSDKIKIDENGNAMLKLKNAMMGCQIAQKYYKVEDGKITITPREEQYSFVTAEMSVGSDTIVVDGVESTLCTKVVEEEDGTILIPADAVTAMTGYKLTSVAQKFDEDYYMDSCARFEIENPEYSPQEDKYISAWIDIAYGGTPIVLNDELYLPLNPTMGEFYVPAENIAVVDGEVTVITDGSIPEFSELKMSVNSNDIYVNSEKITLNNQVIESDGVVYIPAQLLETVNCTVTSVEYFISGEPRYVVNAKRNIILEQRMAEYTYIPEYNSLWVEDEGKAVIEDGEYYLPLYPLMGEFMVRAEDIYETENSATVKSEDPASGFKTLVIEGTSVTMDDTQYVMEKPMLKKDGKSYLPEEFLTNIIGGKIVRMNVFYDGEQTSYNFRIEVPNPLYTEDE